MTDSKESAEPEFVQPVLRNFTGHWAVDVAKSDSIEPLVKALGVNWLARKVLSRVEVTSVITHTPTQLTVVDKFNLGKVVTSILVDRRYHKIYQGDKECRARARQDNETGDMTVEIEWPDGGRTVDTRRLLHRTLMRQVLAYFAPGSHLGPAAAAGGSQHEKPQTTVTRVFNKKETKEEVIANEEAEDRARERLERLGLTAWSWAATGTHPLGAARGGSGAGSSRAMGAGSSLSLSDVPISSSSPKRVRFADAVSVSAGDASAAAAAAGAGGTASETKQAAAGASGSTDSAAASALASAASAATSAAAGAPAAGAGAAAAAVPAAAPGPLLCDLTGVWKVIKDRSDSLEQFFAELGVTWVARKILVKLDVTTTIQQNPEWCSIMDQSSAGESTTKVKTDGNPQTITDAGGKEAVIVASLSRDNGSLCQETLLPGGVGIILDERSLESRTVMRQITQVVKAGVTKVTVNRYFTKIETDEERAAGEKKWEETLKLRQKVRAESKAAAAARPTEAKAKKADEASASPESRRRTFSDAGRDAARTAIAAAERAERAERAGAAAVATAGSSAGAGAGASTLERQPSSSGGSGGAGGGDSKGEGKGDSKAAGASAGSAGGSSGGSSGSDDWQDDEDPFLYVPTFNGRWQLQREKSDDINPLLELMGVPWFYRKIAVGVEVFSSIEHDRKSFTICDQSSFGKFVTSITPNDTWQQVKQYGGGEAKMKTVQDINRDGAMRTETEYQGGKNRLIEIRRLLDRTTMRQVYTFLADGVSTCVVTRFFKKVESDQEKAQCELAEKQRLTRIELRDARRKEKEIAEMEVAKLLLEAKDAEAAAAAAAAVSAASAGASGAGAGAAPDKDAYGQFGHDHEEEDGNLAAQLCIVQ